MPFQPPAVIGDEQVAQFGPRQDEHPVPFRSVRRNVYQQDDQFADGGGEFTLNELPSSLVCDPAEPRHVELPSRGAGRFHLHGRVVAPFVGRDDVILRHVAGERGGDEAAARQLCDRDVLADLLDEFVLTTGSPHTCTVMEVLLCYFYFQRIIDEITDIF